MQAQATALRMVHPVDPTPKTQEYDHPPLEIGQGAFTARMATILWNLSPQGILLSDSEGRVIAMNYQLCRLLNVAQEEVVGKHLWYGWSDDVKRFDVKKVYENLPLNSALGLSSRSYSLSGEFVRTASGRLFLLTMVIPR